MAHLEAFVREEFLVSEDDIRSELTELITGRLRETASVSPISTICIPTGNRPNCLRRALQSYLANLHRHGRTASFVVSDDSEASDVRKENRQVVQTLSRRYGTAVAYIDRDFRRGMAQRLAEAAGVPEDLMRFALLGGGRAGG